MKIPPLQTSITYWKGLAGAALPLALYEIAKKQQPIVLVTPNVNQALRLERELSFFFKGNGTPIWLFPDWETLPYDRFSPHQDIISERLTILSRLSTLTRGIVIISLSTALQYLPPCDYVEQNSFNIKRGDQIDIPQMRQSLEKRGYYAVNEVAQHGEFVVRGSILDLFPMGSDVPYRLDLFDDKIESIRIFDPETQLTTDKIDRVEILPAREFPLTDAGITHFRQQWGLTFDGNPIDCPAYEAISSGTSYAGIEYYMPLFYESVSTLADYLPKDCLFIQVGNLANMADEFWQEISKRYEQRRYDITHPLLAPDRVWQSYDVWSQNLSTFKQVIIDEHDERALDLGAKVLHTLAFNQKGRDSGPLADLLSQDNQRILFCAETLGRRESLLKVLHGRGIKPTAVGSWEEFADSNIVLGLTVAQLEAGVRLPTEITVIAEADLMGYSNIVQRRRKQRQVDSDAIIKNLSELSIGTPVVHIDHGVGRYIGLQTLDLGEAKSEFLTLEYAGGDKLYVPISSLNLISRYSGVELEHLSLNQLGTNKWQRTKKKAAEQIKDVAAELLDIYSRRASREGFQFDGPSEDYYQFANNFPFEETPDQTKAIEEIIEDMTSAQPMDRLVCGDVGFGKTEVAMRAAFLSVQNNKQVAILVPTTLLAQQHYETFTDRFANFPISIDMISRFRTATEQKKSLEQLAEGKLDIVIGTHKLLSEKIKYDRLGLLIIDEEHRFGVNHKEKIKALRSEVDILTLTATPIPRTLNMAMSKMRELSIMSTPPSRRLAIKTFVTQPSNETIREALMRELLRGGQVYVIHNKIDTIKRRADELSELVPESKVAVAHAQMHEHELERIMSDFYHRKYNVLVCTIIVESGIDIPNANTILIERAERFGLAQLHQLRGRVGRSHHQAYAYLLTPDPKVLTADAQKRLEAIESLKGLGTGFLLASNDLEIRGAGDLLGDKQSGHIQAIGFSLYMELLDRAISALKSGKNPSRDLAADSGTEVDLQVTALIPEDYMPDVNLRLSLYKRIASSEGESDLNELQVEMIDRFGLLPEPLKRLFYITQIKLTAQQIGIKKINAHANGGKISFAPEPNINPKVIIDMLQRHPQRYRMEGASTLRVIWKEPDPTARIIALEALLERLGGSASL